MPEPTTTEPPADDATAGTDWKAEARKWEARARANHAAVDELAALKKTSAEEAEAHAKALKDAQDRIAGYEHRDQVHGWKQAAAKAAGVPLDALRGDTEEEITAHAEVLKGLMGSTPVAGGTGISGKAPETATPSAAIQAVRGLFGTNQ